MEWVFHFVQIVSVRCQEECSWILLLLTIPICTNALSGVDTEVEFHPAEHICCELLKVKKIQCWGQSFKQISKIVLKYQVLDRHVNKTRLTHERTHWQASHKFISSLGGKSPIGSLGNHPFTYSRAQGRTHGKLSGKVSRNVFLESPCRRTRWALQSNSDTLNPTYTRRVSEQISKSVKSVSAEADSLNKITQMSQETKLDCLWMTSPCCSYMIQTHTQRWVLFFFSLGCLFKKDCGSKQENDMTRKTKWNQTE